MKYKTIKGDKRKRRSKKNLTKGAFGQPKRLLSHMHNMKVVKMSKRLKENSNLVGVSTLPTIWEALKDDNNT